MARPPLPIGTHGKIRYYQTPAGWRATAKFRDFDGITRPVERVGRTKAAAERQLKVALRDRSGPAKGAVTSESKFRDVAEQWFQSVQAAADSGTRSLGTVGTYRSILDRHVLKGLGAFRMREVTVPVVDAFLSSLQRNIGTATAKTARSVISGVLGLATRRGAISTNPTRETRLESGRKKGPRALTAEERRQWLAQLEADEKAVQKDLPDLSRFMMATGVRIGEALALLWPDVNLDAATVNIDYTVIRVNGKGLVRKPTKTEAGARTLLLPAWAVTMLRQRLERAEDKEGPVFPDSLGGLRDPSNTRRDLRNARGSDGFAWVTSHVFRKTAATVLDEARLTARMIADQLGHARPSMTQDVYMGRTTLSRDAADALEQLLTSSEPAEDEG